MSWPSDMVWRQLASEAYPTRPPFRLENSPDSGSSTHTSLVLTAFGTRLPIAGLAVGGRGGR
jgi:hypothetical protein